MRAPGKCSETPRMVAEYLGSGSDPTAAGEAARHIADCPACRAEIARLEPVTEHLMQWREQPAPEWDRRAVGAGTRRGGLPGWQWVPLAASLVLALAVVFNVELRRHEDGWSLRFGADGANVVQEQRAADPRRDVAALERAVRETLQPDSGAAPSGPGAGDVRGIYLAGQGVLLEVRAGQRQSPGAGGVEGDLVQRPDQDAIRRSLALSLGGDASPTEARAAEEAGEAQREPEGLRDFEQRLYSALCRSGEALPLRDEEYLTVRFRSTDSLSAGGRVHVLPAAALRQCRADDGDVAALEAAARQYSF